MCECAWGMARKKGNCLSKFFRKLQARRGSKKAIAAVARKMMAIINFMLKNDAPYREESCEQAKQKYDESRKRKLFAEARSLGFALAPAEEEAAGQRFLANLIKAALYAGLFGVLFLAHKLPFYGLCLHTAH